MGGIIWRRRGGSENTSHIFPDHAEKISESIVQPSDKGKGKMTQANREILIVDDTPVLRNIMKTQLQRMGFFHIHEAPDGSEAMKILHAKKIDLVISDWNMPVMNGVELLREIRGNEVLKDIPFIMVTAEATVARIGMAMQLKVDELLLKPFTLEILERKIIRVIQ
jgi:two-component system chemotaxis response regulator CheY